MKKKLTPYSDDANDFYIAKYTAEASQFYEQKMLQLVDGDREKLRTEVPNVPLPDHMAYKLEPLFSADGHRQYEFLIEYGKHQPEPGRRNCCSPRYGTGRFRYGKPQRRDRTVPQRLGDGQVGALHHPQQLLSWQKLQLPLPHDRQCQLQPDCIQKCVLLHDEIKSNN